jgi:SAM-dependent methyltransferase
MYTNFATIYDTLMQDMPYERWLARIDRWIETYGISRKHPDPQNREQDCNSEKNLIVELGCGTGIVTENLASRGYDMIGIDNAPAMLSHATEKKERSGNEILYLCQNMTEMELYCTAGTIICVCDSLNYLLTEEEVLKTFKLVSNYLYPGGIFILDFNTAYKYATMVGDATIAESHDDCAYIWENYYHADERINEYDLTFFIKGVDGRYKRYHETHLQKAYELPQIHRLLAATGLEPILAVDDETEDIPTEKSGKIIIAARKT